MAGPKRTNVACMMKTFRFTPELVEDMERIIYLTKGGNGAKYPSMTNLIVVALSDLIKRERRVLEQEGIVWEHLRPNFKQSLNKE